MVFSYSSFASSVGLNTQGGGSSSTYTFGSTNYGAPKVSAFTTVSNVNPYAGALGQTQTSAVYSPYASYIAGNKSTFQPGTVDYGKNYTSSTVNPMYGDYLAKLYGGKGGLPTDAQGRTQYDLAKERLNQEMTDKQKQQDEALRARASLHGMAGSGVEEKGSRNLAAAIAGETAKGLTDISKEELAAQLQQQQQLGAQAFSAEQATQGQNVTRELHYADLTGQELQLAENSRQFDNKQDFDAWATSAGLDDKTKERIWQANENNKSLSLQGELHYADLNEDDKKLAEQARQFDNKEAFDTWAKKMDLDNNQADRIWQASENEANRTADINKIAVTLFADIQRKDYDQYLADKTFKRDNKIKTYGNLGQSGDWQGIYNDPAMTAMGEYAVLQILKSYDPDAYDAYTLGKSGKSVQDMIDQNARDDQELTAFITSFDPTSSGFYDAVSTIFDRVSSGEPIYNKKTDASGVYGSNATDNIYRNAQSPHVNIPQG